MGVNSAFKGLKCVQVMFSAERRVYSCRAVTMYVCAKEKVLPYLKNAASTVQGKGTVSFLDKNYSQELVNCQHD
jgi:hypothetical protein